MQKILLSILLMLLANPAFTQKYGSPDELTSALISKMQQVENYTAKVLIKIDVEYINIKERQAIVYFEAPDSFEFKVQGITLLPRKGTEMEYLSLLNAQHTSIDEGMTDSEGVPARLLKVIPTGAETDIVLAQLWIDEENLRLLKMTSYTKSSGTYTVLFSFTNEPYDLPSEIKVEFDVKNLSLPASMTGDLEAMAKKMEKKGVSRGSVSLLYSDYEVNTK